MKAGRAPWLAALACALALGLAGFSLWWSAGDHTAYHVVRSAWFYDLNSHELFAAPVEAIPPIAAPSGPQRDGAPAGVGAMVLEHDGRQEISFLFTYTLAAKAALEALRADNDSGDTPAQPPLRFVRLPGGDRWFPDKSPEGQALLDQAQATARSPGMTMAAPPENGGHDAPPQ